MSPVARILLACITVFDSLINVTSVSAFSTASSSASLTTTVVSSSSSSSLTTTATTTSGKSTSTSLHQQQPTDPSSSSLTTTRCSWIYSKLRYLPTTRSIHHLRRHVLSSMRKDESLRGGAATSKMALQATPKMDAESSWSQAPPPPVKKSTRVRIAAFDSLRFFLIGCIVLGHFIKFANPNEFLFQFFSQHNVIVGAFFALSGYVTAYTSTEVGQRAPSPKLTSTPSQQWTLSRVFGWYPLHLLTLFLFSPLFIYADQHYNGWIQTAWHGFLSVTLTQAWFPMHAEVWNAPTWYLSGLAFATALMPFALPKMAQMDKKALRKTAVWLTIFNVLPKLGYVYDLGTLSMSEGWTSPKVHPNLALFNMIRFSPALIAAEVLLGAVACRLVMLDDEKDPTTGGNKHPLIRTNAFSTLGPILAIVAAMVLRAGNVIQITDMLVRPLFFLPLFLKFLMASHRNTVRGADTVVDPTVALLSHPLLVWLGSLSFPIYIVHGPLGQIFYKKLIANKLFGQVLSGAGYFAVYLASVFALAWILQVTFLQNKAVSQWSKNTVNKLSSWM